MEKQYELRNFIRKYRKIVGMTQTELAKAVGVSKNTIFSIENHKYGPSAYLAFRICIALGRSFDDLFYLIEAREKDA